MTQAVESRRVSVLDMEKHAQTFLEDNFNMSLNIPIEINNRLSRSLGRFLRRQRFNRDYNTMVEELSFKIEMNGNFVRNNSHKEIMDILEHELVHYALFEQGKPFKDGQVYFENTLAKLGISATQTTQPLMTRQVYECSGCHKEISRGKRFNVNKYVSKCCRTRFIYKGKKVVKTY